MTHTLDTIIDFINDNIFTQEDYDALPQATRDLFEKAQEIENQRYLAWAAEFIEIERETADAERNRCQAIWDACDRGSSESPSGAW